jgi:hypothetical protein
LRRGGGTDNVRATITPHVAGTAQTPPAASGWYNREFPSDREEKAWNIDGWAGLVCESRV